MSMEKEMLGVYLSGHPLDDYRELIETNTTASVSEILEVSSMDTDACPRTCRAWSPPTDGIGTGTEW